MKCKGATAPCTCSDCVRACQENPGWFAPDEAERAIAAGLANRLMLDWWVDFPENVYLLAPASQGCEGKYAPELDVFAPLFPGWNKGKCTFLKRRRCAIHNSGFKPHQCRTYAGNEEVKALWDNDPARALIEHWKKLVGLEAEQ